MVFEIEIYIFLVRKHSCASRIVVLFKLNTANIHVCVGTENIVVIVDCIF